MSRYKAYPEYRNSGVTWLGKTPANWTLAPLKWFIERNDGGVWGNDPDGENDTLVLRSTEQTVDGFWKMDDPAPRKLSSSEKEFALLRTGDLVVTKSSGSSLHIGKTTIVTDEIERMQCCYSNFMQRIRTSQLLLPKLAWYVMNNELSRAQFDFLSNSTTGLANLNGTMVGQIVLAIPSEVEQQAIINFLDHETAKIDALIEKQQLLIELLKEQRQAVISHAVTKGLNPNASMKDSGVQWLGEVPAHWEVKCIRYVIDAIGDVDHYMPPSVEKGVPYLMTGDLKDCISDVSLDDCKQVSHTDFKELSKRIKTSKGDIVMARYATIGTLMYVDVDVEMLVSYSCVTLKTNQAKMLGMYLFQYMKSDAFRQGVEHRINTNTQGNVGIKDLQAMKVAVPPSDEQEAIAAFLAAKNLKMDTLIAKAESTTALLKERRTALISAAVTGKIDVRDWQVAA